VPALNTLATTSHDDSTYGELIHIVHMYVVEPHPQGDPSPYRGTVWEAAYSDRGQARTYDERVADARDMLPLVEGEQLLLVDDLVPRPLNNPAWCTYGPCPNCLYLIGVDGIIEAVQAWADVEAVRTDIDRLL
jgi:hypothetical protein